MASLLALAIFASTLTAVADWAGWHFVWRHENSSEEKSSSKRTITSIFLSYFLPFFPALAILLGPAKLELYNDGFALLASNILFVMMGIITGGVAASAWSVRRRHHEGEDSRKLIDQQDVLPNHAMEHLLWTTIMLIICSIFWFYLFLR